MQRPHIMRCLGALLSMVGARGLFHQFLMAGRREGQGTVSLPPNFFGISIGLTECLAMSGHDVVDEKRQDFLMAEREGEQGTAPPPPYHLPVLAEEVSRWMNAAPGQYLIDGTLGGGGHSEIFLKQGASVLAIDRDSDALEYASRRLSAYREQFHPWQANYAEMADHPAFPNSEKVDGILLDLGVSSHQLDCANRGFSFQKDGPLDMRMGGDALCSAADFVNQSSEDEIMHCIKSLGEDPQARRIAHAITEFRKNTPFTRTSELAGCIENLLGRHGKTHPATRTFQAIRMHINQEMPMLQEALHAALTCLKPGGRLLIITFHSLEDTVVKKFLHEHARPTVDDPTWPAPKPNPYHYLTLPVRKSIAAQRAEILRNPRARSAKLRVAIRNEKPVICTKI